MRRLSRILIGIVVVSTIVLAFAGFTGVLGLGFEGSLYVFGLLIWLDAICAVLALAVSAWLVARGDRGSVWVLAVSLLVVGGAASVVLDVW